MKSQPAGADSNSRTAVRSFAVFSVLMALLAGLPFTAGLPGEFVFDDIPNIVNNTSIHLTELNMAAVTEVLATPQVSGSLRSLPTLTFALDYWRAGGADPAAFKTTNIVIHVLTVLVLAWFFRRVFQLAGVRSAPAGWWALGLAFAWAVHPLQVSAVLYAVQRLQTMGTLFLLLALVAYLQARHAQIEGRPGRTGLLCAVLLWALAMGCKEDSILLPAYTLALELTVLRFAAMDSRLQAVLRRGYLIAALAGTAVFLLWVIPAHWHWDAYPGRDFSTLERLLTQGRVLWLYLWQILFPLPSHMPFHYDWLEPSRGLFQPWSTLPALVGVAALLVLAWSQSHVRPLLALGLFLFFAAHFVASNVIGLELAYEHRNHFALVGAMLAVGSVAMQCPYARPRPALQALLGLLVLAALAAATVQRAHAWRSNVTLAQASTAAAPRSPRAWIELCNAQLLAGGPISRDNTRLDEAITACTAGADSNPETLNSLALLVVLKTLRGDIEARDWDRFQQRLATVRMSWDNIRAPLILTHYAGQGVGLDKARVLTALATLDRRVTLQPHMLVSIGEAILHVLQEPDLAVPYFVKALQRVPPGDPYVRQLMAELTAKGRPDLAGVIESADAAPRDLVRAPATGDGR